jgi:hypothetical protein
MFDALNPEPRQFLRFFDFEAEMIAFAVTPWWAQILRAGCSAPSATRH